MISVLAAIALAPPQRVGLKVDWEWSINKGSVLSMTKDPRRPYLYVAQNEEGFAVLHTGAKPQQRLAARLPKSSFGDLEVTTVLQHDKVVFVALGNFLNPRGSRYGVAAVDVEDAEHPHVLSTWLGDDKGKGASGLALRDGVLAVGLMTRGIALIDAHDPSRLALLGAMRPDPDYPIRDPREPRVPNARGLWFDGSRLFVAYDAGGLRVLDCSEPREPHEIGRYLQPAMLRKQQAFNNVVVQGDLAYVAVDYAGIEVLDVTDPGQIRSLAWWNPWHAERPLSIWFNSPGHTNQLWLHGELLFASAADSEIQVLDVSNPEKARLAGGYGKPKNDLGTWALTGDGDSLYVSYIRSIVPFRGTWAGIKAMRIR